MLVIMIHDGAEDFNKSRINNNNNHDNDKDNDDVPIATETRDSRTDPRTHRWTKPLIELPFATKNVTFMNINR